MVEHSTADREVTGSIPVAPFDSYLFSKRMMCVHDPFCPTKAFFPFLISVYQSLQLLLNSIGHLVRTYLQSLMAISILKKLEFLTCLNSFQFQKASFKSPNEI